MHVENIFDTVNFSQNALMESEYEEYRFINCDFSNVILSNIKFTECLFISCNLSMATVYNTAFRDIKFTNCKILGLHFEHCNENGLSVYFDNCILTHSSFYKLKLKKTHFVNSKIEGVDFTETDLTNSIFDNCDLNEAVFDNTILEKADFRTSFNYSLNPELNRIKKAKFSLNGIAGLLGKYDIDIS